MKRLRKVSGINNNSISGSYYYEFHYFKDMTSYSRRPTMGLPCWGWRERTLLPGAVFTRIL